MDNDAVIRVFSQQTEKLTDGHRIFYGEIEPRVDSRGIILSKRNLWDECVQYLLRRHYAGTERGGLSTLFKLGLNLLEHGTVVRYIWTRGLAGGKQ